MNHEDRKAAIRAYKETVPEMGVYRVRNTANGKSLLGASRDLRAQLNAHRAMLAMGAHNLRPLQEDWNALGAAAFAFEVLDTLEPRNEPGYDPRDDLLALEALWLERLGAEVTEGYGRPHRRL